MKTPSVIRVLIAIVSIAVLVELASEPALSDHHGLWVGTIKYFAMNNSQINVYSSDSRRSLLFFLPPHVPITSADGTQHYKFSDLKVGALVRVHFTTPYDTSYYYGNSVVIGASYVTRIDLLSGAAYHHAMQKALRATLPSPTPGPSPTSPPPVPIIFVSPTPTSR